MFKRFADINELESHVVADKQACGIGSETLNRYPVRFVLLDNFRDCYDFVSFLQADRGVYVESVDKWIDPKYPDILLDHVELADNIERLIRQRSPHDCALAPFSELARFYDNENRKEFDALIKTIKGIQSLSDNQRVYIPLVGLEGKMEAFSDDSQIFIWRLDGDDKDINYRLILTDNQDYGVKGLDSCYTVVNNIRQWLNIWKDSKKQVTPVIICKSTSIYANSHYAQPDNAFSYEVCNNAYEFLTRGLGLSFGTMQYRSSDGENWNLLAQEIDVSQGVDFASFVKSYFSISEIANHQDFIRLWFSHSTIFDRWLLTRFYSESQQDGGYLCPILDSVVNYGTNELIERIAVTFTDVPAEMKARKWCLNYAAAQGVRLSDATEGKLSALLQALATRIGYMGAIGYFTTITRKEKEMAISWLGQGKININDIKGFFPDFYCYMKEGVGISTQDWVENYFKAYKIAKVSNRYTDEIRDLIKIQNEKESAFDTWYHRFCTTYTLMENRRDIEVFYWIDGLGVDWIPLVKQVIAEKKGQQIFLNEVLIARAKLPTKTENNKTDLQRLLPANVPLEKSGDLDSLAHRQTNIPPFTVIEEIALVRKSIEDILDKYIGKKIVIISDHGLTYLSQMLNGLNLAGLESDHHGRIAKRNANSNATDNSYYCLDNGTTLCALKHESLCGKVPKGQGCHGGCTPEEVLVPIFVISSTPVGCNWTAELLTTELSGINPKAKFKIKNIPSTDKPYLDYHGITHELHGVSNDVYESDDLTLDANDSRIVLRIGDVVRDYHVDIQTGVKEDDLFDF